MKKFLTLFLGFSIALPLAFCIVIYLMGCFLSCDILPVHVEWGIIRVYVVIAFVLSFFISLDKDL